jgi:rRNA-processing protein FCF1
MLKPRILLDSNVFDELIKLSDEQLSKIRAKYSLATTNVNVMELERIPDKEKRESILKIAHSCEIINAKILELRSYFDDGPTEDSSGGLSTYEEPSGGGWLRYEDAEVLEKIGIERNKIERGRSRNDAAMARVMMNSDSIGITNETGLRNKLRALGKKMMSSDELLRDVGLI